MNSRCNADDLISPINISKNNVISDCNIKCSLVTNYNKSSVNIHNKGDYLSLDYESNSKDNYHIKFNSIKMNVSEIRLYFPSIHNYNNNQANGELIIIHNGNGSNCIVSIPLTNKKSTTNGEKTLKTILENVKSNIPNKNESSSLNISNFNLSSLIPLNVPYFYYQGQLIFSPCTQNYNYIVLNTPLNIGGDILSQLAKLFKQQRGSVSKPQNLKNLNYNQNGATNVELQGSDDIYIECKPVNELGKIEDDTMESTSDQFNSLQSQIMGNETPKSNLTFEELAKNPAFDVVVSFVGLFVLYTTGKYALSYFKNRNSS